jgi:hypothetical protein
MTAVELLDLFNRYAETEVNALAKIACADFVEHETVCRIRELRRRWALLRWKP